jgi:hypothetical protein
MKGAKTDRQLGSVPYRERSVYTKPQLFQIKLLAEESVLKACKTKYGGGPLDLCYGQGRGRGFPPPWGACRGHGS